MTRVLGVDVGKVGERVGSTVGRTAERSPLGGAARAAGDLGTFLREQREGAQLSLRQLAAAAGVSNPYLSQVERGLRRPSAEVLQQIAKGLRISAEALYVRAGILDERPGRSGEVHAALTADPYLSERQREAMLEIYLTFRAENARSEVPVADGAAPDVTADGTAAAGGPVTATPTTTGPTTTGPTGDAAPDPLDLDEEAAGPFAGSDPLVAEALLAAADADAAHGRESAAPGTPGTATTETPAPDEDPDGRAPAVLPRPTV